MNETPSDSAKPSAGDPLPSSGRARGQCGLPGQVPAASSPLLNLQTKPALAKPFDWSPG